MVASAPLDLDNALWRFVLPFYSREGVSPACLVLQDKLGVYVNVLLFAIFAQVERGITLEVERHALPTNRLPSGDGVLWRLMLARATQEPQKAIQVEPADRSRNGEKPGDLPFQQPTKYQFIVNLKTAKAMGLDVSATLVALADEVIE